MSILDHWKRIRAWYKENTPPNSLRLSGGVAKAELDSLETIIGVRLPRDFRESYLLHDGTDGTRLLYFGILHPITAVVREWELYHNWQKNEGYGQWPPKQLGSSRIKPVWWSPLRLPLTDNGGGDPVTLDLDPAKGGTVGQVIDFNHEVGPTNLLANSFGEWLQVLATGLESGRYIYDEDSLMVRPLDW